MIQREIERKGISTIGISIIRRISEKIRPPRTVFLPFPFGHPLGAPFNVTQQNEILTATFNALYSIKIPGEIIDLPQIWKDRNDRRLPEHHIRIIADAHLKAGN